MKTKIINSSEINKENGFNMSPRFHIEKKEIDREKLILKLNEFKESLFLMVFNQYFNGVLSEEVSNTINCCSNDDLKGLIKELNKRRLIR